MKESVIAGYSDLKKTQITWINSNGMRSLADLCYRTKPISRNANEIMCVVTERSDNPGPSITNAAEQVLDAVCSRFAESDSILVTERYDSRSYLGQVSSNETIPRYAQLARPNMDIGVQFKPVPVEIADFLTEHWNDKSE